MKDKMKKVGTIVTHKKPHFDEYLAIFLLRKFGEEQFPGISIAKIVYWDAGAKTPDGRSADEHEKEGKLLIGVGGGRFDEHPTTSGERKQGECATTLVAKALGIESDESLRKILKFAVNVDLKGVAHPFDLSYLIKIMHQQYPDNPEKVMEWAMAGIEAKCYEQALFWNVTKHEFEQKAETEEVQGPNGKTFNMVTVVSDDEQMNKFARSVHGCSAAIVIQKKSSGNVQIFTNKQHGLTLYDVASMLRFSEQEIKGDIVTKDWGVLASEGSVKGAEEWFFQHEGQMLLNGSLVATEVPATKISLKRIKELVLIGINPSAFEPVFESNCKGGRCRSSRRNECSLYRYGLLRCRRIRYEMKKTG